MHGRQHNRCASREGGADPNHLGAEHVRVDQVDLVATQVGSELPDGCLVIGLVDHVDVHAQPPQALHRRALAQRERADVIPRAVEAKKESRVALLGAPGTAGCQELEEARAKVSSDSVRAPMAAVRRARDRSLVVGSRRRRQRSRGGGHLKETSVGASTLRVKAVDLG